MMDACVVDEGVTCLCSDPGLSMTVRMGPSHFTIWVTFQVSQKTNAIKIQGMKFKVWPQSHFISQLLCYDFRYVK